MSNFTRDRGDEIKGAAHLGWLVFLAIVVIGGLSWGVWYLTVATSDVVGKGNQTIQNNSAEERTFQYKHFLQLDADIRTQAQAAQVSRDAVADFEKAHPNAAADSFNAGQERSQLNTDARGAAQICLGSVNEYNNSVKSFLSHKYVDVRLPDSFNVAACTKDPSLLPASMGGQ